MCDASAQIKSRRAQTDEILEIKRIGNTVYTSPVASSDVPCACLKTGDLLQFQELPEAFRQKHGITGETLAIFNESSSNFSNRDAADKFDFQNSSVVALRDMPLRARVRVLELAENRRAKILAAKATEVITNKITVTVAVLLALFAA